MKSSLTDRTARGVAWLVGQTIAGKTVSLAGQIILAKLLIPEEFGVFALAMTVIAFTALIRQGGVLQVLVQRHERFDRWATPAFWISLCTGALACLMVLALAPLAASAYEEPRLVPVMLVLAIEAPIAALGIVPNARLRTDMRFRVIATIGIGATIVQYTLAVLLADSGFGALSFAIPRPVVALIQTAGYWLAAPPRIRPKLYIRRWKYLLGDSFLVLLAVAAFTATQQGDRMVLGKLLDSAVVGIYFFAFSLSMQTVTLLTVNLQTVLLPVLSKLKGDPVRQANSSIRAARVLGLFTTPLCIAQAVAAAPLIRLIFDETKWGDAIPVFQALNIAMVFRTIVPPAGNLIQATGRFGAYFAAHACSAIIFFAIITPAAYAGGAGGVAWGVVGHAFVNLVLFYHVALRPAHMHAGALLGVALPSIVPATFAGGLAFVLMRQIDGTGTWPDLARLATAGVAFTLAYAALLRVIFPTQYKEVLDLTARFIPTPGSAARSLDG